MGARSLELKVGLFLVVSAAILVGFLFILGTFDFGEGHVLNVTFPNTGGLRDGAKVKIAGVTAGKVKEIQFLGGTVKSRAGKPIYVRIRLEVTEEMAPTLTEGSQFFVSTEGLLGEKYVEISPGPPGAPRIPAGSEVEGEPPVELQVLSARAAGMLDRVQEFVEGDREQLKSVGDSLRTIVEKTERVVSRIDEELPVLVEEGKATLKQARESLARLDSLVEESRTLMAREEGIGDAVTRANRLASRLEEQLPRAVEEVEVLVEESRLAVAEARGTIERLEGELADTSRDARQLMARTGRVVEKLDVERLAGELQEPLGKLVADFSATGERIAGLAGKADGLVGSADALLRDLSQVTAGLRRGEGTLGALLLDRELYDDLRELVLDLKSHPWKALWKN
jgi:phospholipid/cholesterol/gamma-HCH transport system substrate-binding protein